MIEPTGSPPGAPRLRRDDAASPLAVWWLEGTRAAVFLRPRTERLHARPAILLWLLMLIVLSGIAFERLSLEGPALFDGSALASGWLTMLLTLGTCWIVVRSRAASAGPEVESPRTADVFGLLLAQQGVLSVPLGLAYAAAWQWEPLALPSEIEGWPEGVWIASLLWIALAAGIVLWRQASKQGLARAAVVINSALMVLLPVWAPPAPYWAVEPEPALHAAEGPPPFVPTQAIFESQSQALPTALAQLKPGRPGVVDLYAITFAPYAEEDVFSREAGLVSELMRSRFDARQRGVQLQNHASTAADIPWATSQNLRRTIERIAALMNRDEDILFIHLTSHGARDGQLAASFEPLAVDAVTPPQLASWLDDAGVRYRVISISACFSGSWIAPLSGPGTLVMTAADALHTSYGCGRKSELTFFGRAMYDEQLRATHSFEAAHAAVRPVIEQRERAAGKTDGYSNPQISVGLAIRGPLLRLQQRLEAIAPSRR